MENILIIDDDRDVRMSAHFLLSRNGYQVHEVDHPSMALTHIQQQSTDSDYARYELQSRYYLRARRLSFS